MVGDGTVILLPLFLSPTEQGAASLRIAGGYAAHPLASPAHMGDNKAEALIKTR